MHENALVQVTDHSPLGLIPFYRGVVSTGFLYFVDVGKSRRECEEFVNAEAKREAFADART